MPCPFAGQGIFVSSPDMRLGKDGAARGLSQSMSRRANGVGNAAMESAFGTLQSALFYLNRFESIEQHQAGARQ